MCNYKNPVFTNKFRDRNNHTIHLLMIDKLVLIKSNKINVLHHKI